MPLGIEKLSDLATVRVPVRVVFSKLLVHQNILRILGLAKVKRAVSGAAPISEELLEWFNALGFPLFEGYGKKTFYINVDHRGRVHGKSNYGTFDRLFRGIRDIIKVYKIIKNKKINV